MRKFVLTALLLCGGLAGYAQLLNVASTQKVTLPNNGKAITSVISPDGKFVVVSDAYSNNLSKFDLVSNQMTPIAENASCYDVKILNDGSQVIYRESKIGQDRLRRTALKSVNLSNGSVSTIVAPTRNLQGFAVAEGNVFAVNNGKIASKVLKGAKVKAVPTASINHGRLCITVNGRTKEISPNGSEGQSYLWPSVSPDGTKVVYYLATRGCYVCNIDGSNPVHIGVLRAAQWYGNNVIVGMKDLDNGHVVTASKLIASSLDGKVQQTLTDASVKAMYPSTSVESGKISFTTAEGDVYIINLK